VFSLDEILAISSRIAVDDTGKIYVCIDIGAYQFKEIAIASAVAFVDGRTVRADPTSIAANGFQYKIDDVKKTVEKGSTRY
jgi:hypothetical protein